MERRLRRSRGENHEHQSGIRRAAAALAACPVGGVRRRGRADRRAIPVYAMSADPTPILNLVIPPASGLVFIFAGYWSALPVPRRGVGQGALTGAWAVALYVGLGLVASLFVKGTSVTDGFTPAYLTAHALKIVGGAIGGWLARRKVPAAPAA